MASIWGNASFFERDLDSTSHAHHRHPPSACLHCLMFQPFFFNYETLQSAFHTFLFLPNQGQVRFLSLATKKVQTNILQLDCSPERLLYSFGHEIPVFFSSLPTHSCNKHFLSIQYVSGTSLSSTFPEAPAAAPYL